MLSVSTMSQQSINLRGPGFQSRLNHVLAVATDKSPSLPEPTFPRLKSGHNNDYLMWTLTASGAPTGGWGEVPAHWPCSRTLPAPAGTEGCTRADTGLGSGVSHPQHHHSAHSEGQTGPTSERDGQGPLREWEVLQGKEIGGPSGE